MRTPPTRRQRTLTNLAGAVVIASVAAGLLVGGAAANWLAGEGWTAPHPRIRLALFTAGAERPPLVTVIDGPANTATWTICAAIVVAVVALVAVRPLIKAVNLDERAAARGRLPEVRRHVSERSARRAGRFTRPDLAGRNRIHSWWIRRRQPITAFGYVLGEHTDGGQLVASFEQRVRVIARTGWGRPPACSPRSPATCPGQR